MGPVFKDDLEKQYVQVDDPGHDLHFISGLDLLCSGGLFGYEEVGPGK